MRPLASCSSVLGDIVHVHLHSSSVCQGCIPGLSAPALPRTRNVPSTWTAQLGLGSSLGHSQQ